MTGSFLPTLRSVAPKAAQMIEDSLYHDLLRLVIAFDEAEGLVCRIPRPQRHPCAPAQDGEPRRHRIDRDACRGR
jgi:hypothetical protein